MSYKVYLYKTRTGKRVIEDFIDGLDKITQVRVRNTIRLLREYGLGLIRGPWVKKIHIVPSIFELRITGKRQVRLLFFKYEKSTFIVSNIFVKKTQKTPRTEIDLAVKRAKEFI